MGWSPPALTVLATLALTAPPAHAAVAFEELPPPPHVAAAVVSALNEAGQAAGSGWTPPTSGPLPGRLEAVRWDGTTPAILGTGHGSGINERGDVVFSFVTKEGGAQVHYARAWENGRVVDRTPPQRGTGRMTIRDISDAGVIPVGYNNVNDPEFYDNDRAGAWRQGAFADLPLSPQGARSYHQAANHRGSTAGSLAPKDGAAAFAFRCSATGCARLPVAGDGGSYSVAAINESDSVAATWSVGSTSRAVVWTADRPAVLPGDVAGVADNARAINEDGDVVGWHLDEGVREAALWRDGALVDLGTSGESEAVAVNDRGEVVGWHTVDGQPRPFHWRAGVLIGLPTPDDLPAKPAALNNAGVVVGNTLYRDTSRAFRWTLP
ncbi:putative HAF family extracellular repeat protein [Saccharothrix coeruleofusca]|uniref:hypothetical protein n=1 Tax=Saccharothrix coeruleofusca TaxID=33919 RepID=UPI001AE69EC3|nr:hypothetical protein [Saccharothrix coeruleofusca]MBP2335814.1 putative HAF family extracellular repeat protein [Saccharothrix coeruleofusca]